MQALRAQSQASIDQLRASHNASIEDAKSSFDSSLEEQVKHVEKQLATQSLELRATQDDLAKAKAALSNAAPEVDSLRAQLEEAKAAVATAVAAAGEGHVSELENARKALSVAQDDFANVNEAFQMTKESLSQMANSHTVELEEAAKARAEEVTKLRIAFDEEKTALLKERAELAARLAEVEADLNVARAAPAHPPTPPLSPQGNGKATHDAEPGVTREELERLHQAHSHKIMDLEADHAKAVEALKNQLEEVWPCVRCCEM